MNKEREFKHPPLIARNRYITSEIPSSSVQSKNKSWSDSWHNRRQELCTAEQKQALLEFFVRVDWVTAALWARAEKTPLNQSQFVTLIDNFLHSQREDYKFIRQKAQLYRSEYCDGINTTHLDRLHWLYTKGRKDIELDLLKRIIACLIRPTPMNDSGAATEPRRAYKVIDLIYNALYKKPVDALCALPDLTRLETDALLKKTGKLAVLRMGDGCSDGIESYGFHLVLSIQWPFEPLNCSRHILLTLCTADRLDCKFQDYIGNLHNNLDFLEVDFRTLIAFWASQLVMAPPEWTCTGEICKVKNSSHERTCRMCSAIRPTTFHIVSFADATAQIPIFIGPEWITPERYYHRRPIGEIAPYPGPAIDDSHYLDLRGMIDDAKSFWGRVVASSSNLWRTAELDGRQMDADLFADTMWSFLYSDTDVYSELRKTSEFSEMSVHGNTYTENLDRDALRKIHFLYAGVGIDLEPAKTISQLQFVQAFACLARPDGDIKSIEKHAPFDDPQSLLEITNLVYGAIRGTIWERLFLHPSVSRHQSDTILNESKKDFMLRISEIVINRQERHGLSLILSMRHPIGGVGAHIRLTGQCPSDSALSDEHGKSVRGECCFFDRSGNARRTLDFLKNDLAFYIRSLSGQSYEGEYIP